MTEYRMFVRRNKKQQPRGVLVANRNTLGQVVIGWSYVNAKAGDRFNKNRGLAIARARIEVGTDCTVPHEVMRCAKRFKNEVLQHAYDLSKESVSIAGNMGFVSINIGDIAVENNVVHSD